MWDGHHEVQAVSLVQDTLGCLLVRICRDADAFGPSRVLVKKYDVRVDKFPKLADEPGMKEIRFKSRARREHVQG